MGKYHSNISSLVEILNSLNNFLKDYSIYVYLIDTNYHLIWFNNHTRDKFHLSEPSADTTCFKTFWGYSEPCKECPHFNQEDTSCIHRMVLRRKFPGDDSYTFLELISLPVLDSSANLEGFLKIGLDVTSIEKKQMELREKEKLLISIIKTSSDGIVLLDNDERIISWNRGAQEIFGYSAEEIIGKSVISLIPKELMELGEHYYIRKQLLEKGFIRNYETQRLHKNGQMIHVDLISSVLRDEQNQPMGRSVMVKDVSARKELELELRRTIQELSKLNELNEILYATTTLEEILRIILIAVTAGEGLKFNRAFMLLKSEIRNSLQGYVAMGPADENEAQRIWTSLKTRGRSLKEIVNEYQLNLSGSDKVINDLVHAIEIPLDFKNHILIDAMENRVSYHVVQKQIKSDVNLTLEYEGQNLADLLDYHTFLVVPLFTKNDKLGVLITDNKFTGRDITHDDVETLKIFSSQASLAIENAILYERLEDRIAELQRAYQKLETNADRLLRAERLAAIGKVAASVAHEIRNPLVSIGGFARLMDKKMTDNDELKKYTSIIINQVDHLESILNNILGIASPRPPEQVSVNIHDVIYHVLTMMDEVLHKKNIELDLQINCRQPQITGDEKQLFQAIMNIIKNAVEAIPGKGTITIRTECSKQFVDIEVRDSGHGIAREALRKIYDPFFTTKSGGTGLGLAVVHQIIKDHKGYIEISSELDRGTNVKIRLLRSIKKKKNQLVH
ncbi:MAG: PAS domain S-box protein [Calditrichaeota bacterium]|nr:PAS domain S-box protein [Calditrichota bacterium]RQV92562.1 MAG: PAS domain S-box protein [bacterium]RQV99636.1 MAG: PAS domain S-box protein [Calditrichota bacterium]